MDGQYCKPPLPDDNGNSVLRPSQFLFFILNSCVHFELSTLRKKAF